MAKRNKDFSLDIFNNEETQSAADAAAEGFGVENFQKVQSSRLMKLDINEVYPDVLQPRRIIPSSLRSEWFNRNVLDFLQFWCKQTGINPLLVFGEEPHEYEAAHLPEQQSLLNIVNLAITIYRDDLTNPITVTRQGDGYLIETGERRWLAYYLLQMLFPDDDRWLKIPARIVAERSVWRQASENNVRADLNAIGKARQYAILLMDVLGSENMDPSESFDSDREFYAQVADIRVPHGSSGDIMAVMGFSSREALRLYRNLLTLDDMVWQLADDYNIPESVLRKCVGQSTDEQMRIVGLWGKQQGLEIVNTVDNSSAKNTKSVLEEFRVSFDKQVKHWERLIKRANKSQREAIIRELEVKLDQWRTL